MASTRHNFQFDPAFELKDAGVIAASAAALVDSAAKVADLGAGFVHGVVVVDVTAIEVDTANEKYEVEWQLSSVADFSTAALVFCASVLKLGDSSVNGSGIDSAVGRYLLPVCNEFNGTIYRYARLYTRVAGTVTPGGLGYTAFLASF